MHKMHKMRELRIIIELSASAPTAPRQRKLDIEFGRMTTALRAAIVGGEAQLGENSDVQTRVSELEAHVKRSGGGSSSGGVDVFDGAPNSRRCSATWVASARIRTSCSWQDCWRASHGDETRRHDATTRRKRNATSMRREGGEPRR